MITIGSTKIRVGIPRALLYYRYHVLWEKFFLFLGCDVIVSPETNKHILERGLSFSVDESCLASKIFLGHVDWLYDKSDYIFIPRIASYKNGDITCTKFLALYDIVKILFPNKAILSYDIDYLHNHTELKAFLHVGIRLSSHIFRIIHSYIKAKKEFHLSEKHIVLEEEKKYFVSGLKVLIVSHPYNLYDACMGKRVIKFLEENNVTILFADRISKKKMLEISKVLSPSLYWRYNKELVGAISSCKDYADGIIFFSCFPCGPDSLVTELIMRRIDAVPKINIIMDEQYSENGLHTRLESFIDIISERKRSLSS
jgi:predicted nucleotide-binding protein (sugar kinase/HSP70/actin superfamily)